MGNIGGAQITELVIKEGLGWDVGFIRLKEETVLIWSHLVLG